MTKDAVQNQVQVIAHRLVEGLLETPQDAIGLEVDVLAIRRERIAGMRVHGDELHAPQGEIEKAELEHELDATLLDDVGGETRGPIEALCLLVGDLRHAAPPYKSKSTALCWNSRRLISRRYPVIAASWSLPM